MKYITILIFALQISLIAYEEIKTIPPGFNVPDPLSAEASLKLMETKDDLSIKLVANEPLVKDPISIDFGPDGRLWVVEMTDYPTKTEGGLKGSIKYLEDLDKDGVYDKSTIFVSKLNFPTAVKVWRKGILVIAAPDIIYAEDTNGDGTADHQEVLYTGFNKGNEQHLVNSLVWGLDNWIHVANGDSGGKIKSIKTGKILNLRTFDLKIKPDTGEMQLVTGRTQYGRTRDDYGNWFGTNNSNPLKHYVLDYNVLGRNKNISYPPSILQIHETPHSPEIFPSGEPSLRYNNPFSAKRITSACGISIMRDVRLGDSYYNNAFICEPVHNLVHRQVLTTKGVSFQGNRATDEKKSEFLTSKDQWFRPVYTTTGPQGSLWVVDMYRYVIEHPEWIPKEWQAVLKLNAGDDRGRIYKIMNSKSTTQKNKNIRKLAVDEQINLLSSSNGWERDMAHQLLIWNNSADVKEKVIAAWNLENNTFKQIHLLSILNELNILPNEYIFQSLNSKNVYLQIQALKYIRVKNNYSKALINLVTSLLDSKIPNLRFKALIALGEIRSEIAGLALYKELQNQSLTNYEKAAAMSSITPHLNVVFKNYAKQTNSKITIHEGLISTAVALNEYELIAMLLNSPSIENTKRIEIFITLVNSLKRNGRNLDQYISLAPKSLHRAITSIIDETKEIHKKLKNTELDEEYRLSLLPLLGLFPEQLEKDTKLLVSLFKSSNSKMLAEESISKLASLEKFDELLINWNNVSPTLRSKIANECMNRNKGCKILLNWIQKGKIKKSNIDTALIQRFQNHPNLKIQNLAKKVFSVVTNQDRAIIIKNFDKTLTLKGDIHNGKILFSQLCTACHLFNGKGINLGADLNSLSDKSTRALLIAILDPNQAIEDKYQLYTLELNDKQIISGMIKSESSNSVLLQKLDGSTQQIFRTQIKSMKTSGVSAMPEGFEALFTPQKLADIISYIQAPIRTKSNIPFKEKPIQIPGKIEAEDFNKGEAGKAFYDLDKGNKGERYRFDSDSDVIIFEGASNGHCLGWIYKSGWLNYSIEVISSGYYTLEMPVASKGKGGTFHIEIAGKDITGPIQVPDTKSWETLQTISVTNIKLLKGIHNMKVVMDENGKSTAVGDIDYFEFIKVKDLSNALPDSIFNIGLAKVDISPLESIALSGFGGRRNLTKLIKQKLWAKAIAIDDHNGNASVIVTADLIGIPANLRKEVLKKIPSKYELKISNFSISATHTHTGPQVKGVLQYQLLNRNENLDIEDRYIEYLKKQIVSLVKSALDQRKKSTLEWAQGKVTFGVNRRKINSEGKWIAFTRNSGGLTDSALPVLRVLDSKGGIKAIYTNYACHCTTLMRAEFIHGDWAGQVQEDLEKAYPESIAIVSIGCGADIGPKNYSNGEIQKVKENSSEIVNEIQKLMSKSWLPLSERPLIIEKNIKVPLDPIPPKSTWKLLAESTKNSSKRNLAKDILSRIEAGEDIPQYIKYPIQTWSFGKQLSMIFLPGEVVVDYSARLKKELNNTRLWINSYSNGAPGYIISKRLYNEGGYEVDHSRYLYGLPSRIAPNAEDVIVNSVKLLLSDKIMKH